MTEVPTGPGPPFYSIGSVVSQTSPPSRVLPLRGTLLESKSDVS